MLRAARDDNPVSIERAYGEADLKLRIRQGKVAAVLCLTLVPLCIGLDYCVYPSLLKQLFAARLICDVLIVPFFIALFFAMGRRYIHLFQNASVGCTALAICWMIYAAEGGRSTYYAGLNLVIIGACLLFPYRLKEAIAFSLFVIGSYLVACLGHQYWPPHVPRASVSLATPIRIALPNNLYFLTITAIICSTACYYAAQRRFEDFVLRHNLDVNNRELESTLRRLKDTEVQLVQSEKMNALGKLSAGLLHEVNNPLNFTFMALEAAQADAADDPTMKETLADIHQGMGRIRSVISDLRAFAYPTQLSGAEAFTLDDVMSTAQRLTAHELNDVTVTREGIKGFTARGSKDQVVHILMNLLVNAAHATKGKPLGRPARVDVTCEARGELLGITVRDNGCGVKPEHLPRLFEPFFTTKEKGKGTGLGLSICQTIVENHGGRMSVNSVEGQWTAVTFELPAARQEA